MPGPYADLSHRFAFDERMFAVAVEGFTDAMWRARPAPDVGNSAHWILAHVAATRRQARTAARGRVADGGVGGVGGARRAGAGEVQVRRPRRSWTTSARRALRCGPGSTR